MAEKNSILGPPPLQILPTGLLGFLGMKNGGQYPQTLGADQLSPVIDLLNWYLQANAEVVQDNGQSATTTGFITSTTLSVPQGQFWAVLDYGIAAACANAGSELIELCPMCFYPLTSNGFAIGPYVSADSTATVGSQDTAACGRMHRSQIFILPPGAGLGVHVKDVAGPVALNLAARIARLPS